MPPPGARGSQHPRGDWKIWFNQLCTRSALLSYAALVASVTPRAARCVALIDIMLYQCAATSPSRENGAKPAAGETRSEKTARRASPIVLNDSWQGSRLDASQGGRGAHCALHLPRERSTGGGGGVRLSSSQLTNALRLRPHTRRASSPSLA